MLILEFGGVGNTIMQMTKIDVLEMPWTRTADELP